MKVTLISYTPDAPALLAFTKATRLNMTPDLFVDILRNWPKEKLAEELAYMARTIPSSWEFVDFVFLIEGTTRAIAQQITRTRNASFAMQSLRVTDASEIGIENPFPEAETFRERTAEQIKSRIAFHDASVRCRETYSKLIENGAAKEDARGILPLNTHTNLVAKYNLRALVDVCKKRASLRAQGPYVEIAAEMKRLVLEVYPEFEPFFADPNAAAIEMIERVAKELGITTGSGPGWELAKAIDLIRGGA